MRGKYFSGTDVAHCIKIINLACYIERSFMKGIATEFSISVSIDYEFK